MRLIKGRTSEAENRERTTLDVKREVKQTLNLLCFSSSSNPGVRYYHVACYLRLAADALTAPHTPAEKGEIRLAILHLLRGCYDTVLDTVD